MPHQTSRTNPVPKPRRRILLPLVLLVVLALVAAACGGSDRDEESSTSETSSGSSSNGTIDTANCPSSETTGVNGDTIKIGTSLPQSQTYASFQAILRGEQAYFQYLNDELGGVEIDGKKYKIELIDSDDQYQAEQTVANVNKLVTDDQVFALFNVVGTKNNLAIRDFVNEQCVPNLFAATGSPAWGNQDYPWLLGSELVPYPLEAAAFADYLKDENPDATVAILSASDDFGRAYVESFKKAIKGSDISVVKEATYNPDAQIDTKSQIDDLAASNADAFFLGATLLACPNALQNVQTTSWRPLVYMSGTCTSKTLMSNLGPAGEGVLSVAPLMDPNDPQWADNDNMVLYKEKLAQYQPSADATNSIVAYGWSTAALFAETLSRSPAATRVAVMETARALSDIEGIALMLPGVVWSVDEDDWFIGETFQMVQYNATGKYFALIGDLIERNGQTEQFTPPDLINS